MSPHPGSPDFYELLGVSRDASLEDVKRAFREVSKRTHPDAGGNAGLFRLITEAYEVLSDPARRRVYDAGVVKPVDPAVGDAAVALAEREAELAAREQAFQLLFGRVVPSAAAAPSVPVEVAPAPRVGFWATVRAHWLGWGYSVALAGVGPLVWVLWAWADVWGALGVAVRSEAVDGVFSWLVEPSVRWVAVVVLCGAVAAGSFSLQVFVVLNRLELRARQAVAGVWLVLGACLPVLPSLAGFVLLSLAGGLVPFFGWVWGRRRLS